VNPVCRQRPRTVEGACARPQSRGPSSVRLGFPIAEHSLKGPRGRPPHLLRDQVQAGALPAALAISLDVVAIALRCP
jgi:hypothetical protein